MTIAVEADRKAVANKAISKIGDIATLPEITVKIIDIVEDPKSTARDLHEIIKNDPALSAKILKVVNSAFYGLPGQVANMDRAIVLLGLSAVKNIAVAASISHVFKIDRPHPYFSAKALWKHAVAVAVASRRLAVAAGAKGNAEELFLAGLIHDLGILVERQAFSAKFLSAVETCAKNKSDLRESEFEQLGADHQDFGFALGSRWKFPKHLLSVMGYHHNPELLPENERRFVEFIELADLLCCQENIGFSLCCSQREITPELWSDCGVSADSLEEIRETLPEDAAEAERTLS
jgi:HD-like signal output (HDOD) protein